MQKFLHGKNKQRNEFSQQNRMVGIKGLRYWGCPSFFFFFYLGFLSRTFTIQGTAGEGGGYLSNSSLPLPPTLQTLRH